MLRLSLVLALASALAFPTAVAGAAAADSGYVPISAASPPSWQVVGSLKSTLRNWAKRAGWPAPQFMTDADWPVDVPSVIPGSIETALKGLAEGFSRAPARPRIELTVNHVIVVSETGAE